MSPETQQRPEPQLVSRLRRRRKAYRERGRIYKAAWVTAGLVVVAAGLAMLVLPGPALVVLPIGLAMLSLQFAWAEHLLERALARGASAGEAARRMSRRQQIVGGVAVVLAVACVVTLGALYVL